MKNKAYRLSKQHYRLEELRARGVKSVLWSLSKEQLVFFSRHYEIKPKVYLVQTRRFNRIYDIKDPMLRDLHFAHKKGKKEIAIMLTETQKAYLWQYNIKYRPIKYEIVLN